MTIVHSGAVSLFIQALSVGEIGGFVVLFAGYLRGLGASA
jgi:hypothetical protein